jgi:hypothetical protein
VVVQFFDVFLIIFRECSDILIHDSSQENIIQTESTEESDSYHIVQFYVVVEIEDADEWESNHGNYTNVEICVVC